MWQLGPLSTIMNHKALLEIDPDIREFTTIMTTLHYTLIYYMSR